MKSVLVFSTLIALVVAAATTVKPPLCSDKNRSPSSVCCDEHGTNRVDCVFEGGVQYHYCRLDKRSFADCGAKLDAFLDRCYAQSCGRD